MAFLNDIVYDSWPIIINLNSHRIQLHFVLLDIGIYVEVRCDSGASTEGNSIILVDNSIHAI